jgi:hypothetical protein
MEREREEREGGESVEKRKREGEEGEERSRLLLQAQCFPGTGDSS